MPSLVASIQIASILVAWGSGAAAAEPSFALRGEGYVGYSNIHAELPFAEDELDSFAGGGAGSAALVLGPLYLQAEIAGEATNYDQPESETVGGGGRVGLRDTARGAIGFVGSYNEQELEDTAEFDVWRAGLESELFLDRVTLAANLGYSELSAGGLDEDSLYIDAGVSFYPTDRIRLHAMGGAYGVEEGDEAIGLVGADAELLALDVLSLFARWEAGILDDVIEIQQHSLTFGVRVYWGAEEPSLLAYDRGLLKNACVGLQFAFARFC